MFPSATPRTDLTRVPPVWILAVPWLIWGMMGGFIVVPLPQMLVAQGVPGDRAAIAVAIILTPMCWSFLLAPILDVRFRRRTYALVFGVIGVSAAITTVLYHAALGEVEALMLVGFLSTCLFQSAYGGWAGSLIGKGQDGALGAWSSIYNVGGSGVGILICDYALQHFSRTGAAAFIFAAFLAPMAVFRIIPAPPASKILAAASFSRFAREVVSLFKRGEVLVALTLFALPSASFALTNALGAWSDSFHAPASLVSLIGGLGIILGSIAGCAFVPFLARRIPLRPLYLSVGLVGAAFTVGLLLAPRAPWTFGLAFVGENFFQSAAVAACMAIIFEVIGPANPLAATTFAVLAAAQSLPVDYMEFIDARGYHSHGITGAFLSDALISGGVCVLLAIALSFKSRSRHESCAPRATGTNP
jgi:MFS transporter, PAT family, beta-lactamase induction signal transducer AmpG